MHPRLKPSLLNGRMSCLIHRWFPVLLCMLSLEFQDCQSLFVRHTQSGKCIISKDVSFDDDNNWGVRYWAKMVNNCLDVSAQFRYSVELLKNIETKGTFLAGDGGSYKNRFVLYMGKQGPFSNNSKHNLKQSPSGSLYVYKQNKCAARSGDYVAQKKGACSDQEFTFGSVTEQNTKMKDVHCSYIQRMVIKRFEYGDFKKSTDGVFNPSPTIDEKCSSLAACKVKHLCGGKESCKLTVDENDLLSHYCTYHTSKVFYTKYTCVDKNMYKPSITKTPNIRLSDSPNKGFIEIKNISTWIKVYEENWDIKHFQKTLCQHLGFNDTKENGVDKKQLGTAQDIATGDLIFYNYTLTSGSSSCVYLQPLKAKSNIDMSYATCKICDKPLLLNVTTFPDTAFSWNGSVKYKGARFSNDGWCASGVGPHYLLIDLQKDYHITQVVTFADKDQTRWSESYSLKYSHNETLVDQSNIQQVKGNQNGYQASFTPVDIYNVRYLKIKSTDQSNNNFCLRIELCGEVQLPAPVKNLAAKPSNFSVHLSWTIPGPKISSYITHFIIFLNGKEYQTISLEMYRNKITLRKLKPYTEYTVGIQTQDGSLQKSSTVKKNTFKTTEAVPNGPPSGVEFKFRSKDTLSISWIAPKKTYWNGELSGYQICYSTSKVGQNLVCSTTTTSSFLSYNISNLHPSTKYFVTVAAGTKVGYGNKSLEISKITNGGPVKAIKRFYSSLRFEITKPPKYINEVMVVVQSATSNQTRSEDIKTNELKPYKSSTQGQAYVAAYLKVVDLPSTFVVGDGKEYNYNESRKFFNQPLKQNSSYVVFLRYFETEELFYSTEWSSIVRTMIQPPAPNVSKPISTGPTNYSISWSQPSLPDQQTVRNFHINYSTSEVSNKTLRLPKERTSFTISDVAYDSQCTFEIQVETEAGRSNVSSVWWLSNSAPLESVKTKDGYIVTLKKPREDQNIKTVALVLLRLNSESSELPPPEDIKVKKSNPGNKENVPYIAKDFNLTAFNKSTIVVSLRKSEYSRRRKRDIQLNILHPGATYTTAQMNTDNFGNNIWSYWNKPFTTSKVVSGPPINVVLKSRGQHSLEVSWKAPNDDNLQTGVLTGYQVCYSTRIDPLECLEIKSTNVFLLHIQHLRPSTKYFVTVAAGTKAGYGEKSLEINKITNGEPVNPVPASYYSLAVYIPKPAEQMKEVMVIVQIATSNPTPSEDIETNELKLSSKQDSYVTSYLKTDVLPLNFMIGDGKEYDSENEKYINQPLKKGSNYMVFLRFFESQDSYYSTEWSSRVKTMARPPELSSDDETRMDLLIPLVIVSLCFLILLVVFIYYYAKHRRRLQNKNEQPSHEPQASREAEQRKKFDSIQEPGDSYESMDRSHVSLETTYATPDEALGQDKRNSTQSKPGISTVQETSDYMSLNNKRETENVYQPLEHPTSSANRHHAKRIDHRDQAMQYNNPAFNAYSNDD